MEYLDTRITRKSSVMQVLQRATYNTGNCWPKTGLRSLQPALTTNRRLLRRILGTTRSHRSFRLRRIWTRSIGTRNWLIVQSVDCSSLLPSAMDDRFVKVFDQEDEVLRFALMEKKGNGRTFKEQSATIDRLRELANVIVAV